MKLIIGLINGRQLVINDGDKNFVRASEIAFVELSDND